MSELAITPHAIAVLALTVLAFVLFTRERFPIPVTSLIVIARARARPAPVSLRAGRTCVLGPRQIFSGFGHEALVAICCLMVLGRALMVTGALEPLARVLARLWAFNRHVARCSPCSRAPCA